ncbi:MAG: hypothetical protein H6594_06440 [Flavobacteriales bacterium]|nr:hypothetical protein [Flavobacteriales bacterium]
MKQVVLDTAIARTPREVYTLLEREDLKSGDDLKVLQKPASDRETLMAVLVIALMAVLWYMSSKAKKEKERIAAEILDDVFGKYNSAEELGKELKEEFNISVTTETLPAVPGGWSQLSMGTFERAAYGDDEPDISHIAVREPNPAYKPWKKDV